MLSGPLMAEAATGLAIGSDVAPATPVPLSAPGGCGVGSGVGCGCAESGALGFAAVGWGAGDASQSVAESCRESELGGEVGSESGC